MPKKALDLTGEWLFKEYPISARRMRDLENGDWLEAKVPGSIYTDLIRSGLIDSFELNSNPEKFKDLSDRPWIYKRVFDVTADFLDCERVDLVFEGLDTFASVWLNGKLIARTDNMFIAHRFDVTNYLKSGENILLVRFDPAEQRARQLMQRYGSFKDSDFTNPYRVFVRKAQYQFGWDWAPSLPGCGIWRPVRLEAIDKAMVTDLHIQTISCEKNSADVKVALELDVIDSHAPLKCVLSFYSPSGEMVERIALDIEGRCSSVVVRLDKPLLWFPLGYGEPNLYTLELKLFCGSELVDSIRKEFGIRTIQLDSSPDDFGSRFRFILNGQAIYARGADWIPVTSFPGSLDKADYEQLLAAAKEANINMLRVWGGGYYEDPIFYELCSKYGIMVWQDFMFACALYPDRRWFADKVQTEAISIIKSLRDYPCLVLWCGNNEIDWMYYSGQFGKGRKFYGKDIYYKLLPELLDELDGDRPYIPTTPFYQKKKPNDPAEGTVHNWDVWSGGAPTRRYLEKPVPRFVTEFGFQSLPDIRTIESFCGLSDCRVGSRAIEKHDYQVDGNERVYRYVGELFGSTGNFEHFVYLSQLTQARAVKSYVEFLRTHRRVNAGVLFWQFNDCCPAVSWSAVDYLKRPKALYYYAKRFFRGLLVAAIPVIDNTRAGYPPSLAAVNIFLVNDTAEPVTAEICCRLIKLTGVLLDQVRLPISVGPFSVSQPLKLPQSIMGYPHLAEVALEVVVTRDSERLAENLFLFLPDKYIDWPVPKLNTELVFSEPCKACLKISSENVVKDLKVEFDNCLKVSDNYIDVLPGFSRQIIVEFTEPPRQVPRYKILSVNDILGPGSRTS